MTTTYIDPDTNERVTTNHSRLFCYKGDPNRGFEFSCDVHGNVDVASLPLAAQSNFKRCLDGDDGLIDMGTRTYQKRERLCRCGSHEVPWALEDASGIFVAYVCTRCEPETKARYRPEIFTDPGYETCEAKEPD